MKQFEDDLTAAFQLIPVLGLAVTAESLLRQQFACYLDSQFDGLLPAQDTEAQRASTKDVVWPSADIRAFSRG